ncbi:MAG: DUF5132 domain-containing protein [Coleofasciculus sp. G3-WIS-01]|uniref:DUF5132 domain-containing protein n=1 Tax=Coleofasciculus sp. G3-WIS-01 TaxID=3069528 RepID=UPI0032F3966A
MAFKITDLFEDLGVPGVVAGIGAVVAAPLLIPAVAKVGKPVAKAMVKGGIVIYEKGKGMMSETGEVFEDIVAEAKAELAEQKSQAELEPAPNSEIG